MGDTAAESRHDARRDKAPAVKGGGRGRLPFALFLPPGRGGGRLSTAQEPIYGANEPQSAGRAGPDHLFSGRGQPGGRWHGSLRVLAPGAGDPLRHGDAPLCLFSF